MYTQTLHFDVCLEIPSLDWFQSLKQTFINESYHTLVASLTLMALFFHILVARLTLMALF